MILRCLTKCAILSKTEAGSWHNYQSLRYFTRMKTKNKTNFNKKNYKKITFWFCYTFLHSVFHCEISTKTMQWYKKEIKMKTETDGWKRGIKAISAAKWEKYLWCFHSRTNFWQKLRYLMFSGPALWNFISKITPNIALSSAQLITNQLKKINTKQNKRLMQINLSHALRDNKTQTPPSSWKISRYSLPH